MSWIAFSFTSPALLAGVKTVTRRAWSPRHAAQFHAGDVVTAYDRSPRNHGRPVAKIQLVCDPYVENTSQMTLASYEREGLIWLHEHGYAVPDDLRLNAWRDRAEDVYVIEFDLVDVL